LLIDKKVTDLLDAFASPDPTPGGGSAAALAGAVGASLLAMVAGLPKTKTGTPEERAALDEARATLLKHRQSLVELVDRDAGAYDQVVAAFRLPKETPEEKAARTNAIQRGMEAATTVPVETLQECARAITAGRTVAEFGNPSAKSDLAVAMQLLMGGVQGAMFNVMANIGSLKDAAFVDRVKANVQAAQAECGESLGRAYQAAGVFEMMQQAAQVLGPPNLHPKGEAEAQPQHLAKLIAMMLGRLGTAEARRALEALAQSADPAMRTAASETLAKLT